jgi:hypothetical protein
MAQMQRGIASCMTQAPRLCTGTHTSSLSVGLGSKGHPFGFQLRLTSRPSTSLWPMRCLSNGLSFPELWEDHCPPADAHSQARRTHPCSVGPLCGDPPSQPIRNRRDSVLPRFPLWFLSSHEECTPNSLSATCRNRDEATVTLAIAGRPT